MAKPVHPLDREGDWELQITVKRNGRTVAISDQLLGREFDAKWAAFVAGNALERRDELEFVGEARRWIERHEGDQP